MKPPLVHFFSNRRSTRRRCRSVAAFLVLFFVTTDPVYPGWIPSEKANQITASIGKEDAVLLTDSTGKVLFSKNADRMLIPASILKIYTALVALHYLGPGHRFVTEFYLDGNGNLKIKGYGDPLLVSEALSTIAEELGSKNGPGLKGFNDLVMDDSYFNQPIRIPGIEPSFEPYDAPNGALSVNFNTIYFKRNGGTYISAEPQTPLLPFVMGRVKAASVEKGRIILSQDNDETVRYAGLLFSYFFQKAGIASSGRVRKGRVDPSKDRLIYRYISPFKLEQIISKLLEYSNNFIANQLLLTAGASFISPPCTLEKGVQAARVYAQKILKVSNFHFAEGSGISRENRLSARCMDRILDEFTPLRNLLPRDGRVLFKTGTLSGISTRAGYLEAESGELYRYVVLVNTRDKRAETLLTRLIEAIQ